MNNPDTRFAPSRCAAAWGLGALTLMGASIMGQELLSDPEFTAGTPALTLKGWTLSAGAIKTIPKPATGVTLSTERLSPPDGPDRWSGRLMAARPIEVIPGRRYRLTCRVRGEGSFRLGVAEFGWKHASRVIGTVESRCDLTVNVVTQQLAYAPSADGVAWVRPFVEVDGWLNRAELRQASFTAEPASGEVALEAGHFLTEPGGTVRMILKSSAYPVKLLLYGPSGESGPGGSLGGSGAFVDHFTAASVQDGKAGEPVEFAYRLPADAMDGAYRLLAVGPDGASATAGFTVMPAAQAASFLELVNRVAVPKGARWLFLGDSLTANFPGRNYVSLLERAFRWRFGGAVEVINAGIGGNTIAAMAARLERDVLAREPTHVFVFEGANSCKRHFNAATGQMGGWALPESKYEEAWREVLSRLAERKIAIVIMTMAPGDRAIQAMFESTARAFGESKNFWCEPEPVAQVVALQKKLAAAYGATVIDTHAWLSDRMQEQARIPGAHQMHVDDGVHLSEYGSVEVARAVLTAAAAWR